MSTGTSRGGAIQQSMVTTAFELPGLKNTHRGIVRWAIDVDPLGI